MKYILVLITAIQLSLVGGCSNHSSSEVQFAGIMTSDEVLSEILLEAPTEFLIPAQESRLAESRIDIFFGTRLTSITPGESKQIVAEMHGPYYVRRGRSRSFEYIVSRLAVKGGNGYKIECIPFGKSKFSEIALLNAHNFARFIREGILEEGVLKD